MQRAIKRAMRAAAVDKPASCHTLRHCFATHVLKRGGLAVRSPLGVALASVD